MKPVQQIFALVLEQLNLFTKIKKEMNRLIRSLDRKLKNGIIDEKRKKKKQC